MRTVYGKVIKVIPHNRIIKVLTSEKLVSLYMSRKLFKDFGPYFAYSPYVFVNVTDEKKYTNGVNAIEIDSFVKIVRPTKAKGRKDVYYDIQMIKKGVWNLLEHQSYKMFVDLEFTLPSYFQTAQHISEIVQYGIIIEDKDGKVVFEKGELVKPKKPYGLNQRTLKFLSKKYSDFNDACSYTDFYNLLIELIDKYDPKVIAWGKSDMIAMEQSFTYNKLPKIDIRNRYLNLMQVIKNYYNYKNDLGLFSTYQELLGVELDEQAHDALEDAMVAREIYNIFKKNVQKDLEK